MNRKKNRRSLMKPLAVFSVIILMVIPSTSLADPVYEVTVNLDQQYYYPGENVTISGQLTENGSGYEGGGVCPIVTDPNGDMVFGGICMPVDDPEGYYSFTFPLLPDAILGTYNVSLAGHFGEFWEIVVEVNTTFDVVSPTVIADAHGPYGGTLGQPVQFYGNVTGGKPPYTWFWDFGDGNTSEEQNPIHSYNTTGEYLVQLTVTDNQSNSGNDTAAASIYVGYFLMVFTDQSQYYPGDTVTVSGRLTDNETGMPSEVITLEIQDPLGSLFFDTVITNTTGHYTYPYYLLYDAPIGMYNVTARVTINDTPLEASTSFEVLEHVLIVDADGPYLGRVNDPIAFTGEATGGIQPYTWDWDFGDGNTSDEQTPIHTYITTGIYNVTLTVTDLIGTTGNDTTTATIQEQAVFTHTVLTEYGSFTTCEPCVTASEQLFDIYNAHEHDFYYVTLVIDQNEKAEERASEYGITLSPDVYFDGGYRRIFGAQSTMQPYEHAIETCGERTIADIDLNVSVVWNADAELEINITITNNELEDYNGVLRAYVVEPISRYDNYYGDPYHFGLLDFIVEDVSVNDALLVTKTWNGTEQGFGDISQDNIMVIAAVFDSVTGLVDEVTSGVPGKFFSVKITKPVGAVYLLNFELFPFFIPGRLPEIFQSIEVEALIIRHIDIEVETVNVKADVERVEFYIDDFLRFNDTEEPYTWRWDERRSRLFRFHIKVVAYDTDGDTVSDEILVWKFG